MRDRFIELINYNSDDNLVPECLILMLETDFLQALSGFSKSEGIAFNYTGISFDELPLVTYFDYGLESETSVEVFLDYLKIACDVYTEKHKDSKEEVKNLYNKTCEALSKKISM